MKTVITRLLTALLLVPVCGCFQQASLIELNPDGSGKLIVRYLFSERANNPFFQFGSREDKKGDDAKDPSWTEKEIAKTRSKLDGLARQLGEDVSLEKQEPIKKQGWVGIQATYAFKDINKLRLFSGGPLLRERREKKSDSIPVTSAPVPIQFQFKRGEVSELVIHFADGQPAGAASKSDPFEEAGLELKPTARDFSTLLAAGVITAVLQDARVSTIVKINGEVVQTDARHRPKPESVMLLDFDLGKFSQSKAFQRAVAEKWDLGRLFEEEVPGLRGQKPGDTVRVRFRTERSD